MVAQAGSKGPNSLGAALNAHTERQSQSVKELAMYIPLRRAMPRNLMAAFAQQLARYLIQRDKQDRPLLAVLTLYARQVTSLTQHQRTVLCAKQAGTTMHQHRL